MKSRILKRIACLSAVAVLAVSNMTAFAAEQIYTTKRGDNLSKIAKEVYGDGMLWKIIYEANKNQIKDPNRIFANQQLVIPNADDTAEEQTTEEYQTESSVQQNNLTFYQGTSFEMTGFRYEDPLAYGENEDPKHEWFSAPVVIESVTRQDAATPGYQVVTINYAVTGYYAYYENYDSGRIDRLFDIDLPGFLICDVYTGKVFPATTTSVQTVNTTWQDNSYEINYTETGEFGEVDHSISFDEGSVHQEYPSVTLRKTLTVTMPKGYDGLALMMRPVEDTRVAGNNAVGDYITDTWREGSVLIRITDI